VQDPLPETRAGNFDRGLDASNINQVISNYNYTYAGPVRRQNQEMSRLRFPATTFNGWALAGECSVAWLPSGATRSFESAIAMRTWLFVALKVNGRVQFFRQQLTQAAAA